MSQFWTISKKSQDETSLLISGRIGVDMERPATSNRISDELDRCIADIDAHADVNKFDININSSGGHADVALAIYHTLRRHPAFKRVTIEGGACSAAGLIAMAGDHRCIAEDAYIGVHEVHQAVFGRAGILRVIADHIEEMTKSIIDIFSLRSGLSKDEVAKLFRDDSLLTAEQALKLGFVHEVIPARHIPLNNYSIHRIIPENRFVNDCFACKSPCERCLDGKL